MLAYTGLKLISLVFLYIILHSCVADLINNESITGPPYNATRKVGEAVTFSCQVQFGPEPSLTWEFNDVIIFYNYGKIDYPEKNYEKHSVTIEGDTFTLKIKNLTYEDGGKYTCRLLNIKINAMLVVLGEPTLTLPTPTPTEGHLTVFVCEAKFGGPSKDEISQYHHPVLNIALDTNGMQETAQEIGFTDLGKNLYLARKILALKLNESFHGRKITCTIQTRYPLEKVLNSGEVNVQYSVRNVNYTPRKERYRVGSTLICLAEGNPPPSFEWEDIARLGNPSESECLNVTDEMIGPNKWKCTARNVIEERIFEIETVAAFKAVPDSDETGNEPYKGGWKQHAYQSIVAILIVICIIGAVICFVWYRKKNNTDYTVVPVSEPLINSDAMTDPFQIQIDGDHASYKAPPSKSKKFELIIKQLKTTQDFQNQINNIQKLLDEDGEKIIQGCPRVFVMMVKKASILIGSTDYHDIVKKMAEISVAILDKQELPLECLLELLRDKEDLINILDKQQEFLSLVEVLIPLYSDQSRTKLLMAMIVRSEYVSSSKHTFKWNEKFVSTLKILLEKGADPTWIADDWATMERRTRYTAQYKFFWVIFRIIIFKDHLFENVKKILPKFMEKECKMTEHLRGTPLHALMELDWQWFSGQTQQTINNFFQKYIEIIKKVIDQDPSLIDATDWCERTPLQKLFHNISLEENILKNIMEISSLLKSEKSEKNGDYEKDYTVLHYLVEAFPAYYESVTSKGNTEYADIFKKLATPSNVNLKDKYGRTALHMLVGKFGWEIPEHGLKTFRDVVNCLIQLSNTNLDIKDNQGCTVLHVLADKCNQEMSESHRRLFTELMSVLKTQTNIEIPDEKSCTVVHVLAEKFVQNLNNGQMLLEILPLLMTPYNVNAQDKKQATPYSWILKGKLQNGAHDSDMERILLDIEEKLLAKGASDALARKGLQFIQSSACLELIQKLQKKEDLDGHYHRLLDMLNGDGSKILEDDPRIFLTMVKKADILIASPHYVEITKKMAEIYGYLPYKPKQGPLLSLIMLITDKVQPVNVFQHQENMLSLIQLVIPTDSLLSRTKFLKVLINNSEYVSKSAQCFEWTEKFISTLRLLLENDANPIWLAEDWRTMERRARYTAQYKFFWAIFRILLFKSDLSAHLMEVLPLFLPQTMASSKDLRGTPLHAIVELDWNLLLEQQEQLPPEFFRRYNEAIGHVITHSQALVDEKDWCRRTPLQKLLYSISLPDGFLESVIDIVEHLKSNKNISNQDDTGQSVLHYIAESFPIFSTDVVEKEREMFLGLVKSLASSNIDVQDNKNYIALHTLAKTYGQKIPEYFLGLFCDLIEILKTTKNVDFQDHKGRTVLHILAHKFPSDIPEYGVETYLWLMKHLASSSNKTMKDNEGFTVKEKLDVGYNENVAECYKTLYSELINILIE